MRGHLHPVAGLHMRWVLASVDHPFPRWQKAGAGLHLPRLLLAEEVLQACFFLWMYFPACEGRSANLSRWLVGLTSPWLSTGALLQLDIGPAQGTVAVGIATSMAPRWACGS